MRAGSLQPVELTPLLIARFAHAFLGVVAMTFGYALWVDGFAPQPLSSTLAAAVFGVGAVITVRSFRIGVACRNGRVRVRGLLLTRVVAAGSIEEVTDFPALRWRDGAGRRRWTPIVFLGDSPRALSCFRRHNAVEVDRLRRWVARRCP